MSEQLDWLVRNVHEWPVSTPHVIPAGDKLFEHGAMFCEKHIVINGGATWRPLVVYRQQWLDRRAELQGKPSWEDHPDAKCFVQNDSGVWFKNTKSRRVASNSEGGWFNKDMNGGWQQIGRGEVLGDWRDTLGCRPTSLGVSAGEASAAVGDGLRRHAATPTLQDFRDATEELTAALDSFTSMEDSQPMGEDKHAPELLSTATLHAIHHAAFLHRDCQLLLNEPELVVFRTADGELLHCKPKECLIDPDQCGLAARLLCDMSGYPVAPEHMRELCEQMGWHV